jgi:PIN domain nuclease of toxin-antitoxin system
MKYLLDTHTWIWWNMNPGKLSKKVKMLISDTKGYEELLLSAISPWEFSKLLEKRGWGFQATLRIG